MFPKRAWVGSNAAAGVVTHSAPGGFKPPTNGAPSQVKPVSLSVPPGAALMGSPIDPPPAQPPTEEAPVEAAPAPPQDDATKHQLVAVKAEKDRIAKEHANQQSAGQIMARNALDRTNSRVSGILSNTKKLTQGLVGLKMAGVPAPGSNPPQTGGVTPPAAPIIGGKPMPSKTPPTQPTTPAQPAAPAQPEQPAPQQPPTTQPLSSDMKSRNWQLGEYAKTFGDGDWHAAADAAGKKWGPAAAQTVGQAVYSRSVEAQKQQHAQAIQDRNWSWRHPIKTWFGKSHEDWNTATGWDSQQLSDSIASQPAYYGSTTDARTEEQARLNSQKSVADATLSNTYHNAWMRDNAFDKDLGTQVRNYYGNLFSNPATRNKYVSKRITDVADDPSQPWYKRWPAALADFPNMVNQDMTQNIAGGFGALRSGAFKKPFSAEAKQGYKDVGRAAFNVLGPKIPKSWMAYPLDGMMGTNIFSDEKSHTTEGDRRINQYWEARQAEQNQGAPQAPNVVDPALWAQVMQSGGNPDLMAAILPLLRGPDGNGGLMPSNT